MKLLAYFVSALAILGLAVVLVSIPVEANLASKAKLVQRVRTSAADDLFESAGTPVGSPQELIIDDTKAFTGKTSPDGASYVDETYLEEHGVYPLQLKTVRYVAGLTRLAGGGLAIVGALAVLIMKKRTKRLAPTPQATS